MPKMYLMHGFVGAGKTTFSKKLEKETGALRLSADDTMIERHGVNPPPEKFTDYLSVVKADHLESAREAVHKGRDVIIDYGFWSYEDREIYRKEARNMGAEPVLYYIHAPDNVMKERVLRRTRELPPGALVIDENAIAEFRQRFEPLREDEERVSINTYNGE